MRAKVAALILMLALALWSCAPQTELAVEQIDLEAEKGAVADVIGQLWESWETEDLELFSRVVAHDADMVNLGTDAAERWVGWEAFRDSMKKQFDAFDSIEMSAVDQVVKVHEGGAVAWFSSVVRSPPGFAGEAPEV
jgi:hypothetical protein